MKEKYQSKIMEAIHEEAQELFDSGVIDKNRMAEYDKACLVCEPQKIYKIEPAAGVGNVNFVPV